MSFFGNILLSCYCKTLSMTRNQVLGFLCVVLLLSACEQNNSSKKETNAVGPKDPPAGMVWIPTGEFTMGCGEENCTQESMKPHRVKVNGFWMDETEVTNAQFKKFVEETRYITVAERPIDWEELKKQVPPGTPKPPDESLQPGSMVFTPPTSAV